MIQSKLRDRKFGLSHSDQTLSLLSGQIIAAECESILAENSATALGIIEFNCRQGIIAPINMIHTDPKGEIQYCLA